MTRKKLIIFAIFLSLVLAMSAALTLRFRTQPAHPPLSPLLPPQQLVTQVTESTRKTCPSGFILIPGDPQYRTSDFCLMKYDAKCASKADLSTGIQPPHGDACSGEKSGQYFGTYKNNGQGCACTGNKQVVSTKSGFPLAYLPEFDTTSNNAKAYCRVNGWHLITNTEWMTVARNVEKIPENWCDKDGSHCGFLPGTPAKILANGHNDGNNETSVSGSSNNALIAGEDNQPCYGTTTDGSNNCSGKGSQKRTLTLSNHQIIWDLAGNVWSWVDASVLRKDQPQSRTLGKLDQGWIWSEFSPGGKDTVISDNGKGPSLGYDAFRPSHPEWNSTNGVGRIYHYSGETDTNSTPYTFIKGGTWQHGYDSGAFSIHLSPTADKLNINDVSFRCVVDPQ